MDISINHNSKSVNKDACDNLLAAIEECANNSRLSSPNSNCSSIEIIVDPDLSKYDHYEQVTTRIFIIKDDETANINNKALSLFRSYCVGLYSNLFKDIKSILLRLNSNARAQSSTDESTDPNNRANDDEAVQSYQATKPLYTLDRVILSNDTRAQIDRAISLIEQHNKIFNEWGYSEIDPHTKTILCFFGAPGTGKTMCAHALASKLGKKILIASYASIESKWVGEGPKNLQRIFSDAQEQDAILFFDEADSFLSKRVTNAETGSDKHYNRMSNEMFQLLENYNGVIIFATNLVTDFDKAFKSRILAFIEFVEPDHDTRKKLIDIMIPKRLPMLHRLTDEELDTLATISEGFSGREIRKAVLTTLADGATNGVSQFTVKEFEVGFNSVKAENLAIDQQANTDIDSNLITGFLNQNKE